MIDNEADESDRTSGGAATPRRMPTQNLGGLFGPPNRTADLGSLARRATPRPAPTPESGTPAVPRPALAPVPPQADDASAPTPTPVPAPEPPSAPVSVPAAAPARPIEGGRADLSPTGTVRITAVLVSPAVADRLAKYRRGAADRTNTSIVLEAFDEQHQRVPELIARARAAAQPRGSLFPARDDTLHLPGGGGIQVQIRPTVAQLEVIDRITRENGLNSRSQLVAAVLNEFLPGRKDR